MTTYVVDATNWNDPGFWTSISESLGGHTLDFSSLPANFTVNVDKATGRIIISDGTTTFTVGEAGYGGASDATLGGSTVWDFFETLTFGDGAHYVAGDYTPEAITSGAGDDSIFSGAGDDTIDAGDGNNVVYAGTDNDSITAGSGDDLLFGEDGQDTINSGDGDDFVNGGGGADSITGGAGADVLEGGWSDSASDTLHGGAGNALMFGAGGADSLYGDDGADWMDGGWGADFIDGGAGNDRIVGDKDNDTILGGTGRDTLAGGAGADSLSGGDDEDVIYGAAGDIVDGGEGGVDSDTLYVSDVSSISYATAESGTVFFNAGGSLSFSNIENVVTITPDGIVQGTAGNDQIGQFDFDADGDWIDNDDAPGGGEADSVLAGAGDDSVWSNEGDDTVISGDGHDSVYSGSGNDTVYGGDGDLLTADDASGNDTMSLGTGNDLAYGEAGNDVFYGDDGTDTLSGNEGADEISGGDGNDSLQGGQGNDTISGGNDSDSIIGDGQCYDPASYASGSGVTATNLTVTNSADGPIDLWWIDWSGTPVYYATISSGDTYVQSTFEDHNWLLRDEDGYYLELIAGAPNQTVNYGAEGLDDSIDGGAGSDSILGQYGDDTIDGGWGANTPGFTDVANGQNATGSTGTNYFRWLAETASNATITLDDGAGGDRTGDGVADYVLVDTTNKTNTLALRAFDYGTDRIVLQDAYVSISESVTPHGGNDYTYLATITYSGGNTQTFNIEGEGIAPTAADIFTTQIPWTAGDYVNGGSGNDSILGNDGEDTLFGGDGADVIRAGTSVDEAFGDADEDTFIIEDGFGNDTIVGGETFTTGSDSDSIDGSGLTGAVTVSVTADELGTITDGIDTISFSEIENAFTGAGNDSIVATADTSGLGLFGNEGSDTIVGGSRADYIDGGADNDTLTGAAGDDTINGGTGAERIEAGTGNDQIDLGAGDESIFVDQGDTVSGGDGDDFFTLQDLDTSGTGNAAITITGGEGAETNGDTLQLTPDVTLADITFTNTDDAAGGLSGSFAMADGTVVSFSEIENIICFSPGTKILTGHGERDIETLQVGDLVVTRDHGLRPIRWIGKRTVQGTGRFAPVWVGSDVMDGARTGLLVSPQHRILFTGYRAELLFGDSEVLVPARHLIDGRDVVSREQDEVTYIHIMFDRHEVIYAEGIATESFHAGDVALSAICEAAREELFAIFPELRRAPGHHRDTARVCLKKHEAQLLVRGDDAGPDFY